jgi:transposase
VDRSSVLYVSHRPDQAPLMLRIRDLAATRTRVRRTRNVAVRLGVSATTVTKWRCRAVAERLDGLREEPRSGAPRRTEDARIEAVIVRALKRPCRPQFPVKAA